MKRGLAPQMAEAFHVDKYPLEKEQFIGTIDKLGQIDWIKQSLVRGNPPDHENYVLTVVNCYTQYHWDTETKPLDYAALELCLKKMNHTFKGKHIGLPQIGCHLAGGNWDIVKPMIQTYLKDCEVTVVIYKP